MGGDAILMNPAIFDETILGRKTPDPLQFAFNGKTQAHAGHGGGRPILDPGAQQARLTAMLASTPEPGKPRCLYVHIPFCRVRCTFCNFFQNAASPDWIDRYLQHFYQDMARKAATPWAQGAPFDAVYIGGGTPTDLSAAQIRELGLRIRQSFPLAADCELTLEGRLNRFDEAKFMAALEGGFNRFSFGVQSFDTRVRKAAKRLDDREAVLRRIEQLVATDAAPIILDLLFGLPWQDEACWQRDIEDFLASGAHGVDLYQLIEMPGTVMNRLIEQGKQPPPADVPTRARMYAYGAERLEQAGLQRLSVCHWARDPRERSRYNSLAKTRADVLPVGAGAGGQIQGLALMQSRDLDVYQPQCADGRWPLAMLLQTGPDAPRNGELKAAFDLGVLDADRWAAAGYPQLFNELRPLLAVWEDRGLVQLDSHRAELTLAGRFWSVNLASAALQALALAAQPVSSLQENMHDAYRSGVGTHSSSTGHAHPGHGPTTRGERGRSGAGPASQHGHPVERD